MTAATGEVPVELTPREVPDRPPTPVVRTKRSTTRPRAGDLICGECGEANPPERKFCSRCGHSLATAEQVRARWWRRLLPRRGPKVVAVGKRPRNPGERPGRPALRKVVGVVRRVFLLLSFLAVMLYGAYAPFRNLVNDQVAAVKQRVAGAVDSTLSPVRPQSASANALLPEHGAVQAVDVRTDTHWAAPWPRDPQPVLTLDFGENVFLKKMIITGGVPSDLVGHFRPSLLRLSYSNERTEVVTLRDTVDPQEIPLTSGIGMSSVQIQVLSVFPQDGATDVAVTEVELFGVG